MKWLKKTIICLLVSGLSYYIISCERLTKYYMYACIGIFLLCSYLLKSPMNSIFILVTVNVLRLFFDKIIFLLDKKFTFPEVFMCNEDIISFKNIKYLPNPTTSITGMLFPSVNPITSVKKFIIGADKCKGKKINISADLNKKACTENVSKQKRKEEKPEKISTEESNEKENNDVIAEEYNNKIENLKIITTENDTCKNEVEILGKHKSKEKQGFNDNSSSTDNDYIYIEKFSQKNNTLNINKCNNKEEPVQEIEEYLEIDLDLSICSNPETSTNTNTLEYKKEEEEYDNLDKEEVNNKEDIIKTNDNISNCSNSSEQINEKEEQETVDQEYSNDTSSTDSISLVLPYKDINTSDKKNTKVHLDNNNNLSNNFIFEEKSKISV